VKKERSPSRPPADAETAVREVRRGDLPALLDIYNHFVKTSHATFELVPQTLLQRKKWLREHRRGRYPIIVAETGGRVVGYATISKFRERPAYSRTGESSVYVHPDFQGKGVGTLLMEETIVRARKLGYHAIIAGIALPNEPSVKLHEGLGFKFVGNFREVGFKFGQWRDVAFFQLLLDDR
jgi:L-amino acid N-acyltransferase